MSLKKNRHISSYQKTLGIAVVILTVVTTISLLFKTAEYPFFVYSQDDGLILEEQQFPTTIQEEKSNDNDEFNDQYEGGSSINPEPGCDIDAPSGEFRTYAMAGCSAICDTAENMDPEETRNNGGGSPSCSGYTSSAVSYNGYCSPIVSGLQGNVDMMSSELPLPPNAKNTFYVKTNENIYFQCFSFVQMIRAWSEKLDNIPMVGIGWPSGYVNNQSLAGSHGFTYHNIASCIDTIKPGELAYAIWVEHIAAMTIDKDASGNVLVHICEANYDWCGSTRCRTTDPTGAQAEGIVGCLISN